MKIDASGYCSSVHSAGQAGGPGRAGRTRLVVGHEPEHEPPAGQRPHVVGLRGDGDRVARQRLGNPGPDLDPLGSLGRAGTGQERIASLGSAGTASPRDVRSPATSRRPVGASDWPFGVVRGASGGSLARCASESPFTRPRGASGTSLAQWHIARALDRALPARGYPARPPSTTRCSGRPRSSAPRSRRWPSYERGTSITRPGSKPLTGSCG